jgi:hypothetical protein
MQKKLLEFITTYNLGDELVISDEWLIQLHNKETQYIKVESFNALK